MKKEIKEKWLEALRSGKYEQGKGQLKKNDTFCCLGVLCDLYAKEKNISIEEAIHPAYYTLSTNVMKWSELNSSNPQVEGFNLATLNDNFDKSFNEIADIIEKHL